MTKFVRYRLFLWRCFCSSWRRSSRPDLLGDPRPIQLLSPRANRATPRDIAAGVAALPASRCSRFWRQYLRFLWNPPSGGGSLGESPS